MGSSKEGKHRPEGSGQKRLFTSLILFASCPLYQQHSLEEEDAEHVGAGIELSGHEEKKYPKDGKEAEIGVLRRIQAEAWRFCRASSRTPKRAVPTTTR